ncbi:MAG: hypothetical protein HOD43_00165 [Candidatus Marinimicrobia bacterium]|jgi:hypothetical protein|nr:hypothetical protein [Candidatus Neomarinimicrobiota bacterium]MBT3632372.1 hypothetical protein [Candidatus Neomarinimicrobiota bacterium]MBT3825820.1 hypothetical protein [Candidatus Neomarinimicrobiota bacterium]MBT4129758.1 hypothetical protein [Candidatus Neomarinimicrobiota bacterium]MBT4294201.1 hypothetical protein [Candidatus Neomarinimicrobiota bacterium]
MAKARPPIIISNGSIAALLTEGLIANPEGERGSDPIAIIRENIDNMNTKHYVAVKARESGQEYEEADIMIAATLEETNDQVPRVYWRRQLDKKVQNHPIFGQSGRNYYEVGPEETEI